MHLLLLALAAFQTQAIYTAESIVNAASGTPGRLAPNSHASLYGSGLATAISRPRLILNGSPGVVTYSSANQVNFVVPASAGNSLDLIVQLGSLTGPRIRLELVPAAPELFASVEGFVIAAHPDGSLLSAENPARPGQVVVAYGTGFGRTASQAIDDRIPVRADALITRPEIWLAGQLLAVENILYAGVTPGYWALYQLNLRLPDALGEDPELRLGFGGEPSSRAGLRLLVRPAATTQKPDRAGPRSYEYR